jgi:hypothetical protein
VQVEVEEPDYGSNAADDKFVQVLGAYADNPTFAELRSFIEAMNEDDQVELVALAWTGRGDFERGEWDEALRLARERHRGSTALYLCGMPLLGDYLEEVSPLSSCHAPKPIRRISETAGTPHVPVRFGD